MLTVCVHRQPTLGHFVNGHYAIPPVSVSPEIGRTQSAEGPSPSPPVCVDIYASGTDERTRGDPLLPQANSENALQRSPKTWMVSGQGKKKERKHVVHHSTQTHSPQSGLQRDYKSHPGRQRAANASKRAKRCSKLFGFFLFFKRALCLLPCCECKTRLKHLQMH